MQRRTLIQYGAALGATAALSACGGDDDVPASQPRNFVLVHGAWHGKWAWDRVVPRLQAGGANAHAMTLAGLADRAAGISTAINVDTHVADVVSLIRERDLRNVVLVAHSYGGFPATGAIQALAGEGRISTAIYLDAFLPTPGDRLFNYLDAAGQAQIQSDFNAGNPRWPKIPAAFFGLETQADIAYVDSLLTDHPNGTYLQPLALTAPAASGAKKRVYVSCTNPRLDVLDATKARVRADTGWAYLEIAAGHDVMVSRPAELAALLLAQG